MNDIIKPSGSSVYLFGAGASFGYRGSRTDVNPPLATNFFSTFYRLLISQDLEVKIGNIVNYIRDTRGIAPELLPEAFDEDIEKVFSELHEQLEAAIEKGERTIEFFNTAKAYDQFVFWFCHVLNEIQNGEPCEIYSALLSQTEPTDTLITLNWDTILDHALAAKGEWYPDDGYGLSFFKLFDKEWRSPMATESRLKLYKLHGSTNWFGPYVTLDYRDGKRHWLSTEDRVNHNWCVVDGRNWFPAYKNRWRPGYQPYSYFFAPNDPDSGAPLMPIIIPPTGRKNFGEYGEIFSELWARAFEALEAAERLIIVGYSFPETDEHAYDLLDSFLSSSDKSIEIIDPYPEGITARISKHVRGRCGITVHSTTLAEFLGLPNVDNSYSEFQNFGPPAGAREDTEDGRRAHILGQLVTLNMSGQPADITTFTGECHLECKIVGEFATHLLCAYRDEVYRYRTSNIRIHPRGEEETTVDVRNIWLVNPMPKDGFTSEQLSTVDLSGSDDYDPLIGDTLRESIRRGYHCQTEEEVDYFLRRFLAS